MLTYILSLFLIQLRKIRFQLDLIHASFSMWVKQHVLISFKLMPLDLDLGSRPWSAVLLVLGDGSILILFLYLSVLDEDMLWLDSPHSHEPLSWGWALCARVYVLRLVSDNHTANCRAVRALATPNKPANCVLVHKICDQCLGCEWYQVSAVLWYDGLTTLYYTIRGDLFDFCNSGQLAFPVNYVELILLTPSMGNSASLKIGTAWTIARSTCGEASLYPVPCP